MSLKSRDEISHGRFQFFWKKDCESVKTFGFSDTFGNSMVHGFWQYDFQESASNKGGGQNGRTTFSLQNSDTSNINKWKHLISLPFLKS